MLTFGLIAVSVACSFASAQELPPVHEETYNCTLDGSKWPFLIQAPEAAPTAIIINLHGHYSDHRQGMLTRSYNDAWGKLRRECVTRGWAYVTAWYGGNSWMGPEAESGIADLIGLLKQRWPETRVFLIGGSMGGSSTLVFATRRPDLLDGAAAFCPAGDIESYYAFASASDNPTLDNIAAAIRVHYTVDGHSLEDQLAARSALLHPERLTMPLYLSWGEADSLIPPEPARELARILAAMDHPTKSREIPTGDHDSPITQVNWPEVLDFLAADR